MFEQQNEDHEQNYVSNGYMYFTMKQSNAVQPWNHSKISQVYQNTKQLDKNSKAIEFLKTIKRRQFSSQQKSQNSYQVAYVNPKLQTKQYNKLENITQKTSKKFYYFRKTKPSFLPAYQSTHNQIQISNINPYMDDIIFDTKPIGFKANTFKPKHQMYHKLRNSTQLCRRQNVKVHSFEINRRVAKQPDIFKRKISKALSEDKAIIKSNNIMVNEINQLKYNNTHHGIKSSYIALKKFHSKNMTKTKDQSQNKKNTFIIM